MSKPFDVERWAVMLVVLVITAQVLMAFFVVGACAYHYNGQICPAGDKLAETLANLLATAIAFASGVMGRTRPQPPALPEQEKVT